MEWGRELSKSTPFLFRRIYRLAPTDPRFLDATLEEMELDLIAHTFADNPNAQIATVAETSDFEAEAEAMERESREIMERMDREEAEKRAREQLAGAPAGDGEWATVADDTFGGKS